MRPVGPTVPPPTARRPDPDPRGACRERSIIGSVETWKAIDSVRVVRRFAPEPLRPEHLRRILDAGRRTGSSKNLQRWDFIAVQDRVRLKELTAVGPYAGHLAHARAAIALVCPDPKAKDAPHSVMWDLGRAAQNMILAAWELGIGSCPATVYDHEVARRLLGYPEDQHCEYILSFGYPADPDVLTAPNKPGGRRSPAEVSHDERW
jgi:nitroreductase